jgi:uncharacterized protein (DUF1778 family)
VSTRDNPPTRTSSEIVACRLTPEQHGAVVEAARATGRSVSDYLRDALFAAVEATATALEEARSGGFEAARTLARMDSLALEAQLVQARQASAPWQQRAEQLEREVAITSQRLLIAVSRVLGSAPGARAHLARLWACMAIEDQERMLPAVTATIVEQLRGVRDETSTGPYARERGTEVVASANWIDSLLTRAGGGLTNAARTAHQTIVVTALSAELSLIRRGNRPDPAAVDSWISAVLTRSSTPPPPPPDSDRQPTPPELPPQAATSQVAVSLVASLEPSWASRPSTHAGVPYQGYASAGARPQPTLVGDARPIPLGEGNRGGYLERAARDDHPQAVARVGSESDEVDATLLAAIREVSAGPPMDGRDPVLDNAERPATLALDPGVHVADVDAAEPTDLERG